MADPTNLNTSSPGSFQQGSQPVENALTPAQSAPSTAASDIPAVAPATAMTSSTVQAGGSTTTPSSSLGDGFSAPVEAPRVETLQAQSGGGPVVANTPLTGNGLADSPLGLPNATQAVAGAMSPADKIKLDNLPTTPVASVKGWSSTGTGISGPVSFRQTTEVGVDASGGTTPVVFSNPGSFNQNPKIGDRIIGAVSLTGPNNFACLSTSFEPVVTVDNQIQQLANDLSGDTILFSWVHGL